MSIFILYTFGDSRPNHLMDTLIPIMTANYATVNTEVIRMVLFHKTGNTKEIQVMVEQLMCTAPFENVSLGICGQHRPKSACASAQSDQGHHCPLTDSLESATECMNE